jgi:hypothetical protein
LAATEIDRCLHLSEGVLDDGAQAGRRLSIEFTEIDPEPAEATPRFTEEQAAALFSR